MQIYSTAISLCCQPRVFSEMNGITLFNASLLNNIIILQINNLYINLYINEYYYYFIDYNMTGIDNLGYDGVEPRVS